MAPDEEELIEGSGLYVKRPRIPGCPDTQKWILQHMNPSSFQNPAVKDQYTESMHLPLDILRWIEYSKDDFPNAILGYFLEINISCALSFVPYIGFFYPLIYSLLMQMVLGLLL